MGRVTWEELPAAVRAAAEQRLGSPVAQAVRVDDGLTGHLIVRLRTEGQREVFVKGVPTGEAGYGAQVREVQAGALAPAGAPQVLWHLEAGGWHLIATAVVAGRHASLAPGSPDLPGVAQVLTDSRRAVPEGALPCYSARWERWASPEELVLLRGEGLVHGDVHQHNLLMDGHRAWLVDWAAAGRGPGWVDVADAAVRLMEDEHTAQAAVAWASSVPAWRTARPAALAVWAEVHCRSWTARLGPRDAEPACARWRAVLAAAVA